MQQSKKPYFPYFHWILNKQCYLMLYKSKNEKFYQNYCLFFSFFFFVSCGGFKKVDTRKVPISGPERAKKNVKEGRGVSLGKDG